ncbi:UNVERIFIED_CONTAM: hypothetical protein K2H54_057516 [Gekko kuhli]
MKMSAEFSLKNLQLLERTAASEVTSKAQQIHFGKIIFRSEKKQKNKANRKPLQIFTVPSGNGDTPHSPKALISFAFLLASWKSKEWSSSQASKKPLKKVIFRMRVKTDFYQRRHVGNNVSTGFFGTPWIGDLE